MSEFQKELEHLINRHSMENGSNTPDFMLAEYLIGCIANFNRTVMAREDWYGRGKKGVASGPLEIEIVEPTDDERRTGYGL